MQDRIQTPPILTQAEVMTAQAPTPTQALPSEYFNVYGMFLQPFMKYVLDDMSTNPEAYNKDIVLPHLLQLCANSKNLDEAAWFISTLIKTTPPLEVEQVINKLKIKECLLTFLEANDFRSFDKLLNLLEIQFRETLIDRDYIRNILIRGEENIFATALQGNKTDVANYIYEFLYDKYLCLSNEDGLEKSLLEVLKTHKNPELFEKIMSGLINKLGSSKFSYDKIKLNKILTTREYIDQCFENDNLEIFKKIVELSKDQDVIGNQIRYGHSPEFILGQIFEYCIKKGKSKFAILLVEQAMVDLKVIEAKGISPFRNACENGDANLVSFLLSRQDDDKAILKEGRNMLNPFQVACKFANIGVVEFFLNQNPELIDRENSQGKSPLYLACESTNIDLVRFLLSRGANINQKNSSESTALHLACESGNTMTARILLDLGGDCNQENSNQQTPLHLACKSGNLDLVKLLIERGVDINKQDKDQVTPLHLACIFGNIELVNFLVDNGAVLNKENQFLRSSLHIPCEKGDVELVRFLLKNDVDFNRDNNLGSSSDMKYCAIHYACLSGNLELVKLLKDHGADIRKEGAATRSNPILFGFESENIELIKYLFENDFDFQNEEDQKTIKSTLRLASVLENNELVRLIFNKMSENFDKIDDELIQDCLKYSTRGNSETRKISDDFSKKLLQYRNQEAILPVTHQDSQSLKQDSKSCAPSKIEPTEDLTPPSLRSVLQFKLSTLRNSSQVLS